MSTKTNLFVAGVAALILSSCASNSVVSYTRTAEIQTADMVADVRVGADKVAATYKWDGDKKEMICEANLMANAVYVALDKQGADVLVAPQYKVTTELRAGRKYITVEVKGYPGFFENFRYEDRTARSLKVEALEQDRTYLISTRDAQGDVTGYQIVVPVEKCKKTIDLDQTTLDKIVLNGNGQSVRCKKASASVTPVKTETPDVVTVAPTQGIKDIFKKKKK